MLASARMAAAEAFPRVFHCHRFTLRPRGCLGVSPHASSHGFTEAGHLVSLHNTGWLCPHHQKACSRLPYCKTLHQITQRTRSTSASRRP